MLEISLKKTLLMFFMISAAALPAFAFTISGHVTDTAMQPVENVRITIYYILNGNPMEVYWDTTDVNGDYLFGNVNGDTYDIAFRPRTSSGLVPVYLTGVVVNTNLVIDQVLQPGLFLTGTVTDQFGDPIEAVDLNVYNQLTGIKLFTPGDNTDPNGLYEIVIPSGVYQIAYRYRGDLPNPRYVPVELNNVPVYADTSIDVTLVNGFFVSGTVRDPNNAAVVEADLDADNSTTGIAVYTPDDNTDSTGHYLMLVPPGNYDINVAPLPATRLIPDIVYNLQVLSDVTLNFNLQWGNILSGTVRNPNGVGVFNVNIDVQDSLTGLDIFTAWDKTDSSGAYQTVVPSGLFNIEFKPPIAIPYVAGYRQNGYNVSGDAVLNVTVPFGILLSGSVHKTSGPAVPNADIDAIEAGSDISVPLSGDHTDSSGVYATVVVPGMYHIEFEPPRTQCLAARRIPNQILNNNTQISAILDTGMVVSGTITQSGSPIPDMRANAFESVSGQEAFTPGNKSNQTGFYEILIKPLTYDLIYTPDPSSGLPDTITMPDINVNTNKVINIIYGMANFSASPLSGQVPLQVTFTDLSSNNPTSWYWDFGDGGTSALRNPIHTYMNTGLYTVILTVSNGAGYDAQTRRNYINVWQNAAPIADFVGYPRNGIPPMQVDFYDLSQNLPTSWQWDFGDGGTSNLQDPAHVYQDLGYFTVTLTATNQFGSDDTVKVNYIFLSETGGCGPYIVGDFNGSGIFNVADIVNAFSKLIIGSPDAYLQCECPPGGGNIWAVAFDVNNSCSFNIADIVVGYSRLMIGSPELVPCQSCPPGSPSPGPGGQPLYDHPAGAKIKPDRNNGLR